MSTDMHNKTLNRIGAKDAPSLLTRRYVKITSNDEAYENWFHWRKKWQYYLKWISKRNFKKTGVREQLFLILECVLSDPSFPWASIKDFLSCLSEKEIVYDEYLEGGVHHFGDSKGHKVKH